MTTPPVSSGPPASRHRVAHLLRRGARLRLRHLRAAHAAPDRGAGSPRAARRQAGHPRVQPVGGVALLAAGRGGRGVRPSRRLTLTDLFGRRRVLVWSILLYAFSAMAAGFAPSVGWLLFFRCTTFVGVCVEFVAAVAWLAELFPDPKRRESGAGLDPGLLLGGWADGDGRLLPRRPLRRVPARDRRGARAVALHPDLGRHPRPPADRHPPFPAGVTGLAGEEGSRDPQAAEPGRHLPGRPQEGHPGHDPDVRVQLRRRLRLSSTCPASCPASPR